MTRATIEAIGQSAERLDVMSADTAPRFRLADYAVLLKPRVMSLVVFVGLVGLLLAPGAMAPWRAAVAVLCIAVAAGAGSGLGR